MDDKNREFLKKLIATFKTEAREHVDALSSGLIDLERASSAEQQIKIVEVIFREAHSLKGAARAVDITEIETLCQSLESVFTVLKRQEIKTSPELFDVLHQAVDDLSKLLLQLETDTSLKTDPHRQELLQQLQNVAKGIVVPAIVTDPKEKSVPPAIVPDSESSMPAMADKSVLAETVRVPTTKLISVLLQAEEFLLTKLSIGQLVIELQDVTSDIALWEKEWVKVHPRLQKFRSLLEKEEKKNPHNSTGSQIARLIEFLDWNYDYMKSQKAKLTSMAMSARYNHHTLGRMVDGLLDDMKQVLMLPVSSLLGIFPKIVRDLSRVEGKEVELVISGGEVEIDKRILDDLKDPLIHLIRNCIDHGIEKPQERQGKKKPPKGQIIIAVERKSGHVEIRVSDDGTGIDISKIKTSVIKLGLLSMADVERTPDSELLPLIFQSGVTTSPIITNVSGRGLGLAIVREKVEKLGGNIFFETKPGIGITFRIIVPLTLATFRGVIVRIGEFLFILPTINVERVVRVNRENIRTVENRETIVLDGRIIALERLDDLLDMPRSVKPEKSEGDISAVVLASAENRIAVQVDEVINEQEVLSKNLGKQLSRVHNVSGAAVLGTGKVVPILNIANLLKSVGSITRKTAKPSLIPTETKKDKRASALVVEDSITARTLLKNILEATGYQVATAVDGIDAFTQLRSGEFDIVLSDVDMPRMNGFDLTARIRSDKKLSDLPIVLVTALDSRENRERGIEVGANAYIVKSSFDQSNLLEVIRRLI
ncbi:MAG: hybrid sensor histidine kinase/response regulator [Candidatus Marinimicrobia bacterium]|nr:hybrid sensor histidine kinase/response regulator [Candidatus Neomarinimicrobiota bacterium]